MKKLYKSRSSISVNVVLRSKKSLHISFTAQSDGSSVYATDNEEEQYALEHHYKYGKLFRLVSTEDDTANAANGVNEPDDADKENEEIRRVKISDIAAAKDFWPTRSVLAARRYVRKRQSWKPPKPITLNLK